MVTHSLSGPELNGSRSGDLLGGSESVGSSIAVPMRRHTVEVIFPTAGAVSLQQKYCD